MIRRIGLIAAVVVSSTCFAAEGSEEGKPAVTDNVVAAEQSPPAAAEQAAPPAKGAPATGKGTAPAKKPPASGKGAPSQTSGKNPPASKPATSKGTTASKPGTPLTALYLISTSEGYNKDNMGLRKTSAYVEGQNGHFSVSSNYHNGITVHFNIKSDYWGLNFTAAGKQKLEPGIYKNAECFPYNESDRPGLAISACHRGCNKQGGEFEILEIKYNDKNQIEAFAANFIQKCDVSDLPLFGSVRYNSILPVEARFSEILDQKSGTVLYLTKSDPVTGAKSQPILITDEESTFKFHSLPYGGDGVQLFIDDKQQGQWTLDFSAPMEGLFAVGAYENAERYPFQGSLAPGIEIATPSGYFTRPQAAFKVLNLVKGKDGEVESLALNFTAQNEQGEVLEGAIRYNSKVSVDLEKPY